MASLTIWFFSIMLLLLLLVAAFSDIEEKKKSLNVFLLRNLIHTKKGFKPLRVQDIFFCWSNVSR